MKSGELRKRWKCANPTHSLPNTPRNGLYSSNAMSTPPMGMYLKMMVSTNAGIMNST